MYKRKLAKYVICSAWLFFFMSSLYAQPAIITTLATFPVSAELADGVHLPTLSACVYAASKQNCGNNAVCILHFLQTTADCKQGLPIFQALHLLPVNGAVYTNITVLKMSDGNVAMIDNSGHIVTPITDLDIEYAPGFLDLKSQFPAAKLVGVINNFPADVYLSSTVNQLLFYQNIMDATCTANCTPIAYAKILYEFSIDGDFIDATILRIVSPSSITS